MALEHLEGVVVDAAARCRGQSNLQTIKIFENVSINIIDTSVRFIRNDQVEKAYVKSLIDLEHCRIGRQVHTKLSLPVGRTRHFNEREIRQFLKGILGLFA
ncbi:hypothetical protein DSECCO2_555160 [anaerobic digester metagenome]